MYIAQCIAHGKHTKSFTEASKNLVTKYRSENNFVWTILK